jgi:hypothetical protein
LNIWETNLRLIHGARLPQLKKALCARNALFSRIASDSLVRCLAWIVSNDRNAKNEVNLCAKMRRSLRPLRSLPRQIESLARKIECICDLPLYDPLTVSWPARYNPTTEELRACAEQIRQQISEKEACLRQWKNGWSTAGTEALCFLVQTVREKTGRPQFQQIADLLTEASSLFGVATQYDPDAIKMRIHRKAHAVS